MNASDPRPTRNPIERYVVVASNSRGTVMPGWGRSVVPTRCHWPHPETPRAATTESAARRITCSTFKRDVSFAHPMASENLAGRTVAGYRLLERVGEGGTAEVYRAEHPEHGACAFKVLRQRLRGDPVAVKRFLREAGYGARVHHPGVVRTYDLGEADGLS